MPRRIDIELTSHGSDGTFTWRAAGAKQPKGSLAAAAVPDGASVGDVLRAEIEIGLEGVEVVGLSVKEAKAADTTNRIEVIGVPQRGPDVSVALARGGRRRDDDGRRGSRDRGPRDRDRDRDTPRDRDASRDRVAPRDRDASHDRGAPRDRDRGSGPRRPGGPSGPSPREQRKPAQSTTHRNALLAGLGPEQLPVAEQLLRGGMPAVRQAIAEEKTNADAIVAIAEQLLPAVNLASWKDRATSAQAAGKELRLRDLRAVVAASRSLTLDDEARTMAKALQDALNQRATALRDDWLARMTTALDEGRVLDAVRTTARPPEPATRLPAELAVRVSEAAGAAMTADAVDWMFLLEAVIDSPVRRTVKPTGIPDIPEAQDAARRAAGSVPELAKLLGLRIPPPPPPRRPPARRPPLMAAGGGGPAASL
jgi:hypothetical protein